MLTLPSCLNRSQCVIIESRAIQEVEGAMETVNDFVKTAPTFIAKAQVINTRLPNTLLWCCTCRFSRYRYIHIR